MPYKYRIELNEEQYRVLSDIIAVACEDGLETKEQRAAINKFSEATRVPIAVPVKKKSAPAKKKTKLTVDDVKRKMVGLR